MEALTLITKKCTRCGETKPETEFNIKYAMIRRNHCRVCGNKKRNESNRAKGPEFMKLMGYKRAAKRAGITLEQLKQFFIDQNYRCKLCDRPESECHRGLHVDHCHVTGVFRGLLCHSCNTGLGSLRDSVEILTKAIQYLQK